MVILAIFSASAPDYYETFRPTLDGPRQIVVPAKAYGHDLEAMAKAIDDETYVVWVANPNNPTGTHARQEEIEAFVAYLGARTIGVSRDMRVSSPALAAAFIEGALLQGADVDDLVGVLIHARGRGLVPLVYVPTRPARHLRRRSRSDRPGPGGSARRAGEYPRAGPVHNGATVINPRNPATAHGPPAAAHQRHMKVTAAILVVCLCTGGGAGRIVLVGARQ